MGNHRHPLSESLGRAGEAKGYQRAIKARLLVAYDRTLMQRGCRAVRSITPALPEVELLSVRGFPLGRADKAKSE